jgi:hypothetical protein
VVTGYTCVEGSANTRAFLGLDFGVVKPGIKKEIEVVILLR